eukprot:10743314-Alexandrium_andersonii.AAC.1
MTRAGKTHSRRHGSAFRTSVQTPYARHDRRGVSRGAPPHAQRARALLGSPQGPHLGSAPGRP